MLLIKRNVANVRISAFTLIELLLSLSLASLILLGASKLYSDFQLNLQKQQRLMWLQKESHQLLNYLQQHLQHLGYQGSFREQSNFELFEYQGRRYAQPNKDCFIFFYDANHDGCLGKRKTKKSACRIGELNQTSELAKEIFGVKVEHGELSFYADNQLENCTGELCQQLLTNCSSGKWQKLITQADFKVENLTFKWLAKNLVSIALVLSYQDIRYENEAKVFILNADDML